MKKLFFSTIVSLSFLINIPVYAGNDTIMYNHHTYQLFDLSYNWQEAKDYCNSLGGHLVSVTDAGEADVINELVKQGNKNYYWMGLKCDTPCKFTKWVTGEDILYTNWSGNDPNNYFGNENVVCIIKPPVPYGATAYGWVDLPESPATSSSFGGFYNQSNAGFICEWDSTAQTPSPPAAPYEDYSGDGLKPLTIPTSTMEETITTSKTEEIYGSSYPLLQARAINVGSTSFKLKWNKLTGATKYIIYGNRCGRKNKYEYIKSTRKTYYKPKKLKKNVFYKYIVVAVKNKMVISVSKTVHVGTKPKQNPTKVKLDKTKVTLTGKGAGSTFIIKARIKGTKLKQHRKICYETDNVRVANVTKNGVIEAAGPGKCNIYVYAQNGVSAKVAVTVLE